MARSGIHTPKVVADPIYGIIDIRPVLPMVETKEFQALGDKRQLGMSYLTFPSATHTRRAHCLGSYHATRQLADRWLKAGFINEKEGDALAGYALYHDIGHPAFSHVTEDLCRYDNDEMGLRIVRRLKKEIEACGINFKLMLELMAHKNPLYLAVHDKNLGMEKLDYLERDALYTILSRPVGVEYLRQHIYFVKNQIAIDRKAIDNAIEIQNFYMKMYKNVYLRKTSEIAQRMLQKMVYHLIASGQVGADDLPELTDSELLGIMRFSKNPTVAALYGLLKKRELFRETVVIRPEKFMHAETKTAKEIAMFGVGDKQIEYLVNAPALQQKNQKALEALEERIASLAKLPSGSVLVVPVFNPHRFEAKDIMIYEGGSKLASLKERYPAHFRNMAEVAQAYIAFRICTPEKHRSALSAPKTAKKIFDLIMAG